MFSSLQHPPYRFLWLSSLLWSTSRWMEVVVLGWLVLEMTDSPFMVGLVTAARGAPFLFFGALGGEVADRVRSRPRLLVAAQSSMLGIALLLAFLTASGLVQVWHLVVLAFMAGTNMAFDQPTRQALVFDLVGAQDLMNAVALNSTAWNLARLVGPAMGGLLLGWIGVSGCFLLMAATYLVGVGAILLIRAPAHRPSGTASAWRNLQEGFHYILHSRTTLTLLLLEVATGLFALPYILALLPVFARDVLGVGAPGLGFLTAALGLGALLGALGMAFLGNTWRKGRVLLVSVLMYGLTLSLFSLSPWYPVSLVMLALVGGFSTLYNATTTTLLQTTVPDELRGRLMGAYVVSWGFMPLGSLQAGAMGSWVGASLAGSLGGLALAIFALAVIRLATSLRRL